MAFAYEIGAEPKDSTLMTRTSVQHTRLVERVDSNQVDERFVQYTGGQDEGLGPSGVLAVSLDELC